MRFFKSVTAFCFLFLMSACVDDQSKLAPDVLRVRIQSEATAFNPLLPMPGHSRFLCQDMFYTLGTIDPQTLELKPLMVKSLPVPNRVQGGEHDGMLAYPFELWEEAAWDDGKAITAEDFVFSMKLLFHPYLPTRPWRGYYSKVRDVEIDPENPKKFTVFLSDYYILGLASLCQFPIYPKHHYDPKSDLDKVDLKALFDEKTAKDWAASDSTAQKEFAAFFTADRTKNDTAFIMGAGPYRLTAILPQQGTVLEKKANYWGDKVAEKNPYLRAYPKRVEYQFISDEGAIETAMRNGQLDVITSLSMDKFEALKNDPDLAEQYDFFLQDVSAYNYWMLNNRNPILSDKKVRKALAYLVDYQAINDEIYNGTFSRIVGPVHPSKPYFNKDMKPIETDLAKAKALLAEAGWTDSDGNGILDKTTDGRKQNLSLKVLSSPLSESSKAIGELVARSCKKVGIDLAMDWKDIRVISEETQQGNYDCALLAAALFPGLDDLYQTYHTESLSPAGDNRSCYSSAEADALIEAIRIEMDEKKRNELYRRLQAVLYEDMPVVFLGSSKERIIVSKRFEAVVTSNRPYYVAPYFKLKSE